MFRSGIFTLMEKGAGLLFSFGAAVVLLRTLDKTAFATWGMFVLLGYFVDMGRSGLLQNGLIRLIGLHRHDTLALAQMHTAALQINLAYSLASALALWLLGPWLAALWQMPHLPHLWAWYLPVALVQGIQAHLNMVQQAHFEFRGIFWSTFFNRGILFLYALWCWLAAQPVELSVLALAMLLGASVGAGASALYARSYLHPLVPHAGHWRRALLQFGKFVLGTNLCTMLYKSTDKLALGQLIGPAAFAVYDAAGKITQLVEAPAFSIASVVFPESTRRWQEQGKKGIKALYEHSTGAILAIILPFLLLVWCFARPIMVLFAGPAYLESADILRITAFFGLFMPFAVQFGAILDATGRPEVNFRYTALTALVNLALCFFLVKAFGLYGAAWGVLIGYGISFAWMQYRLYRDFGICWWRAFALLPALYREGWRRLRYRQTL